MKKAQQAGLPLLLSALVGCSSYRTIAHERCPPTFGAECHGAFAEYLERDPEGARAAYRTHVRRLAAACVGPVDAGARERCAIVAALRAHATMSEVLRAHRVPASIDPDALPADWEGALAMVRDLCPGAAERGAASCLWPAPCSLGDRRSIPGAAGPGRAACALRQSFDRVDQGDDQDEPWFNGPAREVVVAALLDRRDRLPAGDVAGRAMLLARARRLSAVIGDPRYAEHYSERSERLLARLAATTTVSGAEGAERALVVLAAAVGRGGFDPASAAGRELIEALDGDELRLSADSRARLVEVVESAAQGTLGAAAAQGTYPHAFEALEVLQRLGEPAAVARWRAALRVGGAPHEAALSARHLAAGRPGSAWLHGMVVVALGGEYDSAPVDRSLAPTFPLARGRVHLDFAGCPWADLPGAAVGVGSLSTATLRWTRCASSERRWETQEARTFTAQEERTVTEQVTGVRGSNYNTFGRVDTSPGITQSVSVTHTYTVPVTRTVTDYFSHRRLESEAAIEATVRVDDRVVTVSWAEVRPPVEETQTTSPARPRRFSEMTLDLHRHPVRESLATWLRPGGGLQRTLALDAASRLVAEARRASDPETVDDLYARAYYGARAALDPQARAHLRDRLGLSESRMHAVFEP